MHDSCTSTARGLSRCRRPRSLPTVPSVSTPTMPRRLARRSTRPECEAGACCLEGPRKRAVPGAALSKPPPKRRRGSANPGRGQEHPLPKGLWVTGHPGEGLSSLLPNPLPVEVATPQAARQSPIDWRWHPSRSPTVPLILPGPERLSGRRHDQDLTQLMRRSPSPLDPWRRGCRLYRRGTN